MWKSNLGPWKKQRTMAEGREDISDCFLIWKLHQATKKTRKRNTKYIFAYTRRSKEKQTALAFSTLGSSRIEGSDAKKELKTQRLFVRLYGLDLQVLFPKETKQLPFSNPYREIHVCSLEIQRGTTLKVIRSGIGACGEKSSYQAVGPLFSSFLCLAAEKKKEERRKAKRIPIMVTKAISQTVNIKAENATNSGSQDIRLDQHWCFQKGK